MKNLVSWLSFGTIVLAVVLASIYCGACAANYLHDVFNVSGFWCFALVPVVVIVALAVELFIMLGLTKFSRQ